MGAKTLDRVIWMASAWLLSYPDAQVRERLPLIEEALAEQGRPAHEMLRVCRWLATADDLTAATNYVAIFDHTRKHALHLSYWTDGDTRRRGEVLGRFKQVYRDSGFLVNTHGELPDHLSLVCEFAAFDPARGAKLLQAYRPSLELLRLALLAEKTPYADVVAAVCATLPGASPTDRRAVMAMANAGPPQEKVGLQG